MNVFEGVGTYELKPRNQRFILLNALPLNAIKNDYFVIEAVRIHPSILEGIIGKFAREYGVEVKNYIRHEATVRWINQKLGLQIQPSSELYEYQKGDKLIIVTLKNPQRGKEVVELKDEDLDIIIAEVFGIK
jgi:hypothetical protein